MTNGDKASEKGSCCCGGDQDHKDGCCTPRPMNNIVSIVAVVVALGAVAYASSKDGSYAPVKPKIEASELIKGEDSVVAKIDGKDVHKSQVAMAIKELGANVPPENVDAVLPAFVDQYINLQLINDAAAKAGTVKEEDVQNQIALAGEQIVRAAYLRSLFEGKITEDQLKAAYKAKFEDQPMPEEVHARHILVETEDQAKNIIAQLRRGVSFAKLAQENSKDPSAQRGGDLGYFTKADMVKEFGDAAFAMKSGEVSRTPVKTQFGWHVIKVEDKRQRKKPTFEEAKGALEQQARQAILDGKIAEMRADAKIEVLVKPTEQAPAGAPAAPAPEGK